MQSSESTLKAFPLSSNVLSSCYELEFQIEPLARSDCLSAGSP